MQKSSGERTHHSFLCIKRQKQKKTPSFIEEIHKQEESIPTIMRRKLAIQRPFEDCKATNQACRKRMNPPETPQTSLTEERVTGHIEEKFL